jgi:sugar lactone lactonase YvrE
MLNKLKWLGPLARRRVLVIGALALSACAQPTALPPTATAVPPTAAPPTAVAVTATPAATAAPTAIVPILATSASLHEPSSVAFDAEGNLYFADCDQVYALDSAGMMTLIAGGASGFGAYTGDGGTALHAALEPCIPGIAVDGAGRVLVLSPHNNRIRRFEIGGLIDSVVGTGPVLDVSATLGAITGAFAGDGGPANEASLWAPSAMAFDQQGNLYILDSENYRVRKVDPAGIITTIAGVGTFGFSGDGGPALEAQMRGAGRGIAVDAAGNVYFADTRNARIRKIDTDGIITTIAGTGEHGFSGDGGPALEAQLSNPGALAVDAQGRLYFADNVSGDLTESRVRMIDADGIITTIATDYSPGGEDAPGTGSLAVDAQGNVYYADSGNRLIKKIAPDGTITVVAGGGA